MNTKILLFAAFVYSVCLCGAGCQSSESTGQATAPALTTPEAPLPPDQQYGVLFEAVQMSGLFADSKAFADALPRQAPAAIVEAYLATYKTTGFKLQDFVAKHFELPASYTANYQTNTAHTTEQHIAQLWSVLLRQPDSTQQRGSLLALPHAYIVPGGRFREIYYWDSYFTMLGLFKQGNIALAENMINNFAYLITTYGHIPNGNRSYYLSRSQPPFFALMVEELAKHKGEAVYKTYYEALQKEYAFWMRGKAGINGDTGASERVVQLDSVSTLNRYWDDNPAPRQEAYKEDVRLAAQVGGDKATLYRHLRAAAESGWDFSSRWLKDGKTLATIHTTDIVPVDLNCLLYQLEVTLAKAAAAMQQIAVAEDFTRKSAARKLAIQRYCWHEKAGFYTDYDHTVRQPLDKPTLAGVYPLFFGLAIPAQAEATAKRITASFLQSGGVSTTLVKTGQQWDAPNGWAPLQYMTVRGLLRYDQITLADTIVQRWLRLNDQTYKATGKMMEKYDVVHKNLKTGGGEYPNQDGFGWTNGVYIAFKNLNLTSPTPQGGLSPE